MGNIIKYGMVGGGPGAFIGDVHRKAINLDNSAKLAAGCFSHNYENTVKMGQELGVDKDRCYKTYEDMVKAESMREDKIDFVVIVTPNDTHYAICKVFLEAGINIVCDKPLAVNSKQAEELSKLAKEKDLLFMVTYTYMGYVTIKHAREIIKAGEIGRIRTVAAEYPQGWLAYEGENGGKQGSWRCDPKQSGNTNCLGDIGTHIENAVATMPLLNNQVQLLSF